MPAGRLDQSPPPASMRLAPLSGQLLSDRLIRSLCRALAAPGRPEPSSAGRSLGLFRIALRVLILSRGAGQGAGGMARAGRSPQAPADPPENACSSWPPKGRPRPGLSSRLGSRGSASPCSTQRRLAARGALHAGRPGRFATPRESLPGARPESRCPSSQRERGGGALVRRPPRRNGRCAQRPKASARRYHWGRPSGSQTRKSNRSAGDPCPASRFLANTDQHVVQGDLDGARLVTRSAKAGGLATSPHSSTPL